jgi:hypothetical protein
MAGDHAEPELVPSVDDAETTEGAAESASPPALARRDLTRRDLSRRDFTRFGMLAGGMLVSAP